MKIPLSASQLVNAGIMMPEEESIYFLDWLEAGIANIFSTWKYCHITPISYKFLQQRVHHQKDNVFGKPQN